MNTWLIAGASSAALLAAAHSFLGERYIVQPILAADLKGVLPRQNFQKVIIRFAWHLTSIAWLGFAFVLVGLGRPDETSFIGRVIAATFLAHAVITAISSRLRHFAWVLFLIVAAGAWLGTRNL